MNSCLLHLRHITNKERTQKVLVTLKCHSDAGSQVHHTNEFVFGMLPGFALFVWQLRNATSSLLVVELLNFTSFISVICPTSNDD